MAPQRFPPTSPKVSFQEEERAVLEHWRQDDTFHKSILLREQAGAKDYVFYDGPPFATGLPHYGHILTSYIKDTVPRYFTMRGFRVDRRWGWDCHGLPIENEIEQSLGITGKRQIEQLGIAEFNGRCSRAVLRYTQEWEDIITRLGRWVDFRRDYKTMDLGYMESVLHVFWQLHDRGLIYEGNKVVPYCYRCQTPLSNFEARLDDSFRPRQDPSVTVMFRLLESSLDAPEYVLAWTTTPWTLPSNVGLAVGADIEYVLVRDPDGYFWVARERLPEYAGVAKNASEVRSAKGTELVGRRYEPLMPYFSNLAQAGAFRVVAADFVTTEDGTGVVHLAPAFGEEDADAGRREQLPAPNPVDAEGRFTEEVSDFVGVNVHEANKGVVKWLKDHRLLVRQQTLEHNYPHCWRDDTPLIYKAVPTWYVDVTAAKAKMLAANQRINWIPSHIRDGRFGDWLSNARDWAISRNRFWGAPLPVWKCDRTGELFVPRSVAELSARWGKPVTDLHRPAIDEVTFPSPAGGTFRRVSEVLDCWFESGSMPYAQVHYPFENKDWFENNFPADFIVEYIAQTRGWFYTLVVLGAALFDKPPFANCICHGVVLAADGRKMSKRLKNYPDPMEVVDKYGSDSLRTALLSSPVVRGGNLRFAEDDVKKTMQAFLIPFWNAFHFFATYANIDGWQPPEGPERAVPRPFNRTDRYILAKFEELREAIERSMSAYDIVAAYEALQDFIEQLNNWYIRLSRRRFWSEDGGDATESKEAAYAVLYAVLRGLALVSAPFTPFMSETVYRGLCGAQTSVHLQDWPLARPERHDTELVREVETVQRIVFLGRQLREQHNIKIRQPLRAARVAGVSEHLIAEYRDEIQTELNVKDVELLSEPDKVVRPVYKPVSRILGPKLGKDFRAVMEALRQGALTVNEDGSVLAAGVVLLPDEYTREVVALDDQTDCAAQGTLIVVLTVDLDPSLVQEGIARELIRAVQVLRKELDLPYAQRVVLRIGSDSKQLVAVATKHREWIAGETLAVQLNTHAVAEAGERAKTVEVADAPVTLELTPVED
ncbi:MAG: isoleucine--tRNA ligase [Polyangiaceae bacterium]|nr:isoleucine--tRNA ligase [Polyangiaceae bacterium]